jgi:hypothetical protein
MSIQALDYSVHLVPALVIGFDVCEEVMFVHKAFDVQCDIVGPPV